MRLQWAPYSNETTGRTPKGIRTFSKGIVKSVYLALVGAGSAAITAFKPLVWYLGSYPVAPLDDSSSDAWRVDAIVYVMSPAGATGTVAVSPSWGARTAVSAPVTLLPGVETPVNISLHVPPQTISLWWPNGVRAQRPLYTLNASFTPAAGAGGIAAAPVSTARAVGFRTLALVTDDDSEPARLANTSGSGSLTMRVKVNGADIFARGGNWIPLEELEGRNSDAAHVAAVRSAADAGFNMLRIWGGGITPPDSFLDAADAAGVLLYIDAMYASQADSHHFAAPGAEQLAELQASLRRLAAHPSVALYDQGNELGGSGVFASFVGPAMAAEDPSRPLWPSSPSSGWASGVDRLWGRPQPGATLAIIDSHAPVGPVPGCNCTSQGNAFVYGFPLSPFLDPLPARDAAACCALCGATPSCVAANYESGGCQLVALPIAPLYRPSSEALVLYTPAAVAAGVLAQVPAPNQREQHGPYTGGGGWPTVRRRARGRRNGA